MNKGLSRFIMNRADEGNVLMNKHTKIEQAKRMMLALLASDTDPEYLWQTTFDAAKCVDQLESEGQEAFSEWIFYCVKSDPIGFVLDLLVRIKDAHECGSLSKDCLEHGPAVDRFLDQLDSILLALRRPQFGRAA